MERPGLLYASFRPPPPPCSNLLHKEPLSIRILWMGARTKCRWSQSIHSDGQLEAQAGSLYSLDVHKSPSGADRGSQQVSIHFGGAFPRARRQGLRTARTWESLISSPVTFKPVHAGHRVSHLLHPPPLHSILSPISLTVPHWSSKQLPGL